METQRPLRDTHFGTIILVKSQAHSPALFISVRTTMQSQRRMISTTTLKIGQAFVGLWKESQTGRSKPNRDLAYELVTTIKSVFEFEQFEITGANDSQTLFVVIDGRSYDLFEVGAGLAQFIVVLTHAATARPSYPHR